MLGWRLHVARFPQRKGPQPIAFLSRRTKIDPSSRPRLARPSSPPTLRSSRPTVRASFAKKLRFGVGRHALEGFTIALLSDFHYDPYFSVHPIRSSISLVKDLDPDLIALTGDFVSDPFSRHKAKSGWAAEPCAQLLRQMQAPYGLWAVLGNHDAATDPNRVTNSLRAQGIQVLVNQSVPIEANGARFWLAGVDDVLEARADLDAALHNIPADEPVILLAHEPDYADHVAHYSVDLQLSGHSHGGQVRVPFVGALYLPVWPRSTFGAYTKLARSRFTPTQA